MMKSDLKIEDIKKALHDAGAPGAVSQAVLGLVCEIRDKTDILNALLRDPRFDLVVRMIW